MASDRTYTVVEPIDGEQNRKIRRKKARRAVVDDEQHPDRPTPNRQKYVGILRTRANANRIVRTEEYRNRFDFEALISDIIRIHAEIGEDAAALKDKPFLMRDEQAKWATRLAYLKERNAVNFKLLNKILPDLASVSIDDGKGGNPFEAMAQEFAKALARGSS